MPQPQTNPKKIPKLLKTDIEFAVLDSLADGPLRWHALDKMTRDWMTEHASSEKPTTPLEIVLTVVRLTSRDLIRVNPDDRLALTKLGDEIFERNAED